VSPRCFRADGPLGFTLAPIGSHDLALANGHQGVLMTLGGMAAIRPGVSAYTSMTRRGFGFLGRILATALQANGDVKDVQWRRRAATKAFERLDPQGLQ
jgi:hypothetical protein